MQRSYYAHPHRSSNWLQFWFPVLMHNIHSYKVQTWKFKEISEATQNNVSRILLRVIWISILVKSSLFFKKKKLLILTEFPRGLFHFSASLALHMFVVWEAHSGLRCDWDDSFANGYFVTKTSSSEPGLLLFSTHNMKNILPPSRVSYSTSAGTWLAFTSALHMPFGKANHLLPAHNLAPSIWNVSPRRKSIQTTDGEWQPWHSLLLHLLVCHLLYSPTEPCGL